MVLLTDLCLVGVAPKAKYCCDMVLCKDAPRWLHDCDASCIRSIHIRSIHTYILHTYKYNSLSTNTAQSLMMIKNRVPKHMSSYPLLYKKVEISVSSLGRFLECWKYNIYVIVTVHVQT